MRRVRPILQRFREQFKAPLLDHFADLICFRAEPMVNRARFQKIVRPHLLASATAAPLRFALSAVTGVAFLLLAFLNTGRKDAQRLAFVVRLVAAVDDHDNAGRLMYRTHARSGLLLVLPAWTLAHRIAQFHFAIWQSLDFRFVRQWHDCNGYHRSLLASAPLRRRASLNAMLARFVPERLPDTLAANLGHDLAGCRIKQVHNEAAPLRVS